MELTQARLKEILRYSRKTGQFTWRVKRGRSASGTVAGTTRRDGYVAISVDGALYLAHRLAWLYCYGALPVRSLDHKNRVRDDNRISNLREVTPQQNLENTTRANRRNKTGLRGVTFDPRDGRYYARIFSDGVQHSLGGYSTAEEAHAAYLQSKQRLHAGFIRS